MDIFNDFLQMTNFDSFYQGRIAEQIVAQNITAYFRNYPVQLLYWVRERREGIEVQGAFSWPLFDKPNK